MTDLIDADTNEVIGTATAAQTEASNASQAKGEHGIIRIDADGDVIVPGGFGAEKARRVYASPLTLHLADPSYADRFNNDDENRWHIVVAAKLDGQPDCALSRRAPNATEPFGGDWRLLTEAEAHELADAWNNDDREAGQATVIAVYRFDNDPVWTEDLA